MELHIERLRKANPVMLDNILGSLLKELGFGPDIYLEKIKKNWNTIVGKTNARNTKPVKIKNGILTITVSSPVWMTQARFYQSSFIEKINNFDSQNSNKIKKISFKLDSS